MLGSDLSRISDVVNSIIKNSNYSIRNPLKVQIISDSYDFGSIPQDDFQAQFLEYQKNRLWAFRWLRDNGFIDFVSIQPLFFPGENVDNANLFERLKVQQYIDITMIDWTRFQSFYLEIIGLIPVRSEKILKKDFILGVYEDKHIYLEFNESTGLSNGEKQIKNLTPLQTILCSLLFDSPKGTIFKTFNLEEGVYGNESEPDKKRQERLKKLVQKLNLKVKKDLGIDKCIQYTTSTILRMY